MRSNLWVSSLIPAGLVVETVIQDSDTIFMAARAVKTRPANGDEEAHPIDL